MNIIARSRTKSFTSFVGQQECIAVVSGTKAFWYFLFFYTQGLCIPLNQIVEAKFHYAKDEVSHEALLWFYAAVVRSK